MANILWARIPRGSGNKHESRNSHDISISLHADESGNIIRAHFSFRNSIQDQFANEDHILTGHVEYVMVGLSPDGRRLCFCDSPKFGKKLTTGGPKMRNSLNRYINFTPGRFVSNGYASAWNWICAHPGNYNVFHDEEGNAYITPFEEAEEKHILWAKRA